MGRGSSAPHLLLALVPTRCPPATSSPADGAFIVAGGGPAIAVVGAAGGGAGAAGGRGGAHARLSCGFDPSGSRWEEHWSAADSAPNPAARAAAILNSWTTPANPYTPSNSSHVGLGLPRTSPSPLGASGAGEAATRCKTVAEVAAAVAAAWELPIGCCDSRGRSSPAVNTPFFAELVDVCGKVPTPIAKLVLRWFNKSGAGGARHGGANGGAGGGGGCGNGLSVCACAGRVSSRKIEAFTQLLNCTRSVPNSVLRRLKLLVFFALLISPKRQVTALEYGHQWFPTFGPLKTENDISQVFNVLLRSDKCAAVALHFLHQAATPLADRFLLRIAANRCNRREQWVSVFGDHIPRLLSGTRRTLEAALLLPRPPVDCRYAQRIDFQNRWARVSYDVKELCFALHKTGRTIQKDLFDDWPVDTVYALYNSLQLNELKTDPVVARLFQVTWKRAAPFLCVADPIDVDGKDPTAVWTAFATAFVRGTNATPVASLSSAAAEEARPRDPATGQDPIAADRPQPPAAPQSLEVSHATAPPPSEIYNGVSSGTVPTHSASSPELASDEAGSERNVDKNEVAPAASHPSGDVADSAVDSPLWISPPSEVALRTAGRLTKENFRTFSRALQSMMSDKLAADDL